MWFKSYVDIHAGASSPATSLAEDDTSELVVDEDAADVESEDAADTDDVQPLNLTTKRSDLMSGSGKKTLAPKMTQSLMRHLEISSRQKFNHTRRRTKLNRFPSSSERVNVSLIRRGMHYRC